MFSETNNKAIAYELDQNNKCDFKEREMLKSKSEVRENFEKIFLRDLTCHSGYEEHESRVWLRQRRMIIFDEG